MSRLVVTSGLSCFSFHCIMYLSLTFDSLHCIFVCCLMIIMTVLYIYIYIVSCKLYYMKH